ncbi:hypothetical protein [Streptomyces sp. V1I1]|uniref:hypothetical protein n=1 Tax=Streptomyces sp. V1I1 TaxID=3042272 RepID=UPI002787BDCF|nr:hypothetical protein [Streptomyces sp. V1I1]MDQ0941771.1 hypothetical protein [Streptomyces sp. V1I1]
MTREEQVITGLLEECRAVSERLTAYLLLGEKILASSVVLISLGVSVAINSGKLYLLIGLPFALSFLVVYLLFLNTEALSLGGYQAALEREVARKAGFPVAHWESEIARLRHGAMANICIRAMIGVVYASSVAVALIQSVATTSSERLGPMNGIICIVGTSVSILLGSTSIVLSFIAEQRAHANVKAISESVIRNAAA